MSSSTTTTLSSTDTNSATTSLSSTLASSTTSSITSTSKTSTSTKKSTSMPKVTTTSSTTSSSSSTWTTPTITPPSAADNPNIWRTDSPSGLVFIAVGVVAAFITICILIFLFVRKLMARRQAKQTLSLSSNSSFDPTNDDHYTEKLANKFYNPASQFTTLNNSSTKLPLLYENNLMNNSQSDFADFHNRPIENMFSTLEASDNSKRQSMFISPTAEVMNLQKKHRTRSSLGNIDSFNDSNFSDTHHNASNSDYTIDNSDPGNNDNTYLGGVENSSRAPNRGRASVPSVYMDKMFDEE